MADGRLSWADFEQSFRTIAPPQHRAKAWMPFFHLSGRAGLWSLWLEDDQACFLDLAKRKPTSAASLSRRANQARLEASLLPALESPGTVAAIRSRLTQLLEGT